ncbi:MAG: Gfo/Idh/MocA family oxidoreductase [Armatimonadetes bacterium]|nr:Gfo/Idh/MocA family oxidoreductase [Armatimonadota bacterium]
MPSTPVRLALIGCGGMARIHLNAYGSLKQKGIQTFEITAVCDPALDRAEQFAALAAEWGDRPTVYADLEALLRDRPPDAVDVTTPHHLHHTTAIACLEAGAHVLIEKPLGVTIRAARRMIEAAQRTGRTLATAEQVRRWIGPRATRWALQEAGLIGAPRLFFAQNSGGDRHAHPDERRSPLPFTWRQDKLTGGGGFIFDGGVHYADVLLYFFGDVETVYAFVGDVNAWEWPLPDGGTRRISVEDTCVAHLTFADGVVGTWTWTGAAPGRGINYTVYHGSHGSVYSEGIYPTHPELQWWNGEVVPYEELIRRFLASLGAEERECLFPAALFPDPASLSGDHGVELEVYDFLEAVRTGRPPELDGFAGLRAQAVVTAFFESHISGQPVRVADVLAGRVDAYQREIDAAWGLR